MKKIFASVSMLAFAFCLTVGASAAPAAPAQPDPHPWTQSTESVSVAPDHGGQVGPIACGRACILAGGSCAGRYCI
jgi:hypothetical protein